MGKFKDLLPDSFPTTEDLDRMETQQVIWRLQRLQKAMQEMNFVGMYRELFPHAPTEAEQMYKIQRELDDIITKHST